MKIQNQQTNKYIRQIDNINCVVYNAGGEDDTELTSIQNLVAGVAV